MTSDLPSTLTGEALALWAALEFRKPMLLRYVEPLTHDELVWRPPDGGNSIAWQLWHIAEVEDNWVRQLLLGEERRFPFGMSVRTAGDRDFPAKDALLHYLEEVRALTYGRLRAHNAGDFDRVVHDAHFGALTVREVWAGVATSFAWHAGQVPLTLRLLRYHSDRST
jgi:uncharacterized damage-inducible protein DinB